ncbi:MAG: disulfide bond formation protein B [Pseudomonadota bacterium]
MIDFTKRLLSCPFAMFAGFGLLSTLALAMALISQYFFGLAPCNLCIIQRYPYGVVIALGIIGLWAAKKKPVLTPWLLALTGVSFLFNSVVAFYHSGVELKWWKSFLEGCQVPALSNDINEMMAQIQAAIKVVPCDEIPWADPILGLSMANYNVAFCLGLAVVALTAIIIQKKKSGA